MPPKFTMLTDYTCLEVRGADAGQFLQAQLSRTLEPPDSDRAPLAGWHDARGRVRALLRVCPRPDGWWLVTASDGAEQLAQRLRLFVLRAAVTLKVAADVGIGAVLQADAEWLAALGLPADAPSATVAERGALSWLCVGPGYWQVIGRRSALAALGSSLAPATPDAAALAEIRLGLPLVTAALADRFVAQMLNLDRLDALSFDKGCYPGQEIIARVRNLGSAKRHLRRYAASTADQPAPGTPIMAARDESVGEVVRSAPTESGYELLAVVEDTAAGEPLTSDGAALAEQPLPFDARTG